VDRPSSRLIHESLQALNEHEGQMTIEKIGFDRRLMRVREKTTTTFATTMRQMSFFFLHARAQSPAIVGLPRKSNVYTELFHDSLDCRSVFLDCRSVCLNSNLNRDDIYTFSLVCLNSNLNRYDIYTFSLE
jgi:hypothetical protein